MQIFWTKGWSGPSLAFRKLVTQCYRAITFYNFPSLPSNHSKITKKKTEQHAKADEISISRPRFPTGDYFTFRPREARQGAIHLRAARSRSYPWCARLAESFVQNRACRSARASASNPMTVAAARRARTTPRLHEAAQPRASSAVFGLHSACINPGDRPREKRRVQCPMPREHAPPRREQLRPGPSPSTWLCEFSSVLLFPFALRYSLSSWLFKFFERI